MAGLPLAEAVRSRCGTPMDCVLCLDADERVSALLRAGRFSRQGAGFAAAAGFSCAHHRILRAASCATANAYPDVVRLLTGGAALERYEIHENTTRVQAARPSFAARLEELRLPKSPPPITTAAALRRDHAQAIVGAASACAWCGCW